MTDQIFQDYLTTKTKENYKLIIQNLRFFNDFLCYCGNEFDANAVGESNFSLLKEANPIFHSKNSL